MTEKISGPPVRIIGSRELHQKLPLILKELEENNARFVVTVHGKPRAVLVGAASYLGLIQGKQEPSEALVGLQLSALLGTTLDDHSHDVYRDHINPDVLPKS